MPFTHKCIMELAPDRWKCAGNDLIDMRHVELKIQCKVNKLLHEEGNRDTTRKKICHKCLEQLTESSDDEEIEADCAIKALYDHEYSKTQDRQVNHAETQTESELLLIDFSLDRTDFSLLTMETREKLAYKLGLSISPTVMNDIPVLHNECKDPENLSNLQLMEYSRKLSPVIVKFLRGVGKKTSESPSDGDLYMLCKTVESVLTYASSSMLLPLHFRESVILYAMSKSKIALQMLCGSSPYASYKSVKKWLVTLGAMPSTLPNRDTLVSFDNNQIIKRSWTVSVNKKSNTSAITMIIAFSFNDCQLQYEDKFSANGAKYNQEDGKKLKLVHQNSDVRFLHNQHLYPFIEKRIAKVINEHRYENEKFLDCVDDEIQRLNEKEEASKICDRCHNKYSNRKRKCTTCKVPLKKISTPDPVEPEKKSSAAASVKTEYKVKIEKSDRIGARLKLKREVIDDVDELPDDKTHIETPHCDVLKPALVNPCSYKSVANVLQNIGVQSGIDQYDTSGTRKWLTVCCDGLPYVLGSRIIKSAKRCSSCKEMCLSNEEIAAHKQTKCPSESFPFEFNWVNLQPGPGHVEMNMVRTFMEFTWPIFMKETANMLNFTSDKAEQAAKKVTDHHKGWAMMTIARNAIIDELVTLYVRHKLNDNTDTDLNAREFALFIRHATNPNVRFMGEVVLEVLEAIFMYREGTRHQRIDLMKAGRAIFGPMWFARKHPMYRELDICDSLQTMKMDKVVQDHTEKYISINMSGIEGTAEGPDFRLEEVNRTVQRFMPPIPTDKDWTSVCANFKPLSELRSNIFKEKGIQDPILKFTKPVTSSTEKEELAMRVIFRQNNYLKNVDEKKAHVSLSGKELDEDLVNFMLTAKEQRENYIDLIIKNQIQNSPKQIPFPDWKPVFVTKEERENYLSIENKNLSQIKQIIQDKLKKIQDVNTQLEYKELWKTMLHEQKPPKINFIQFYYELEYCLFRETMTEEQAEDCTHDEN